MFEKIKELIKKYPNLNIRFSDASLIFGSNKDVVMISFYDRMKNKTASQIIADDLLLIAEDTIIANEVFDHLEYELYLKED